MNSLYIRLDGEQGERIKQLMIDRDCSAQKVGAHILRSFFSKPSDATVETTSKSVTVIKKQAKRFVKPTWEEAANYFHEIGSKTCQDSAHAFIDHFDSNGWKVGGKTPMKDWKASIRNFNRGSKNETNKSKRLTTADSLDLDSIDY